MEYMQLYKLSEKKLLCDMEIQDEKKTTTSPNVDISNEILDNIKDTDILLAESKKEQEIINAQLDKKTEKVIYDNNLPDSKKYKKQEKIKYTTHKTNRKTKLCEKKVYEIHVDHFKQYKRAAFKRSAPRNVLCACASCIIILSDMFSMIYAIATVPELWWLWNIIMIAVIVASLLLSYLLIKMNLSIELENVVTDSELQKNIENSHEV
jgi:cation transport ATPase